MKSRASSIQFFEEFVIKLRDSISSGGSIQADDDAVHKSFYIFQEELIKNI